VSASNESPGSLITHPDGSIQIGEVVHQPWPSLAVLPERARAHHQEIIRADPGSPYYDFACRIPHNVRELVRAMPNYQWGLLELVAANLTYGYAMLRDFPALAQLIVRHFRPMAHRDRTTYLRAALLRPWRDLLREFGLPPRPRTLRILGMLPREHCYPQIVDKLVQALQTKGHPWIHAVPHLSRLTRDGVCLLASKSAYLNFDLLRASVDSDADSETVYSLVCSIRCLLLDLGREEWPYRNVTFEGLKLVEGRLHDRGFVDLCLPFPEPPLPGLIEVIEPIRNYGALVDEGVAQEHCVGTLVADVVRGELAQCASSTSPL